MKIGAARQPWNSQPNGPAQRLELEPDPRFQHGGPVIIGCHLQNAVASHLRLPKHSAGFKEKAFGDN